MIYKVPSLHFFSHESSVEYRDVGMKVFFLFFIFVYTQYLSKLSLFIMVFSVFFDLISTSLDSLGLDILRIDI